ncbi:MAG: ribosome-associated translation inhibitor RaiA [Clostridioides sp.]|jgi:putative sigma-54 modulation protein|nr:ribosome-associated translation inhibitor RaiA [Clostridioides sp.]
MNIIITGRQIEITDAIRDKVEKQLEKLGNFIGESTDVKVTISARKERQTIEVTVHPVSGPVVRAEDTEIDLYSAIDRVSDKLKTQMNKYSKRIRDRRTENDSIRFMEAEVNTPDIDADFDDAGDDYDIKIERHKKFNIKPMTEEEAVLQMDLLGHDFYVFRHDSTDEVAVVYRRYNGGYGIIEQE